MRTALLAILVALPLTACSGSSQQVLTGRVAPGFPTAITGVKVLSGSQVVATATVDASGAFRLEVPASQQLTLRLVGGGHSDVAFPRKTGAIQRTFSIREGGEPFDLGAIHFVGNASTTTFVFDHGDDGCDDNDQDTDGATCVDDDGGGDDGVCTGSGSGSGSGSGIGSGSGSGIVIGVVAPKDGSDDGSDDNDSAGGDGSDTGDAVCEHDFPEDGCAGGDDGGGHEAKLPYDVKPQLGATATPILDAFAAENAVVPTIVSVTDDGGWRLTELQNSTPFVVTQDDCSHQGNRDVGRDRVIVTWKNPDGTTQTDHLDIRYCQQ